MVNTVGYLVVPITCSYGVSYLAGEVEENFLDSRTKAHFEKVIGLIQNKGFQIFRLESHLAVLQEVEKPFNAAQGENEHHATIRQKVMRQIKTWSVKVTMDVVGTVSEHSTQVFSR